MLNEDLQQLSNTLDGHDFMTRLLDRQVGDLVDEGRRNGVLYPFAFALGLQDARANRVFRKYADLMDMDCDENEQTDDFMLFVVSVEFGLGLLPRPNSKPEWIEEPLRRREYLLAVVADDRISVAKYEKRYRRISKVEALAHIASWFEQP